MTVMTWVLVSVITAALSSLAAADSLPTRLSILDLHARRNGFEMKVRTFGSPFPEGAWHFVITSHGALVLEGDYYGAAGSAGRVDDVYNLRSDVPEAGAKLLMPVIKDRLKTDEDTYEAILKFFLRNGQIATLGLSYYDFHVLGFLFAQQYPRVIPTGGSFGGGHPKREAEEQVFSFSLSVIESGRLSLIENFGYLSLVDGERCVANDFSSAAPLSFSKDAQGNPKLVLVDGRLPTDRPELYSRVVSSILREFHPGASSVPIESMTTRTITGRFDVESGCATALEVESTRRVPDSI